MLGAQSCSVCPSIDVEYAIGLECIHGTHLCVGRAKQETTVQECCNIVLDHAVIFCLATTKLCKIW